MKGILQSMTNYHFARIPSTRMSAGQVVANETDVRHMRAEIPRDILMKTPAFFTVLRLVHPKNNSSTCRFCAVYKAVESFTTNILWLTARSALRDGCKPRSCLKRRRGSTGEG